MVYKGNKTKVDGQEQKNQSSNAKVQEEALPTSAKKLEQILRESLQNSADLNLRQLVRGKKTLSLFYISNLTNTSSLQSDILSSLQNIEEDNLTPSHLVNLLPVAEIQLVSDVKIVKYCLARGWVLLSVQGYHKALLINLAQYKERSLSTAENETHVFGPQLAFSESIASNTALVRQYIADPMLKIENYKIGKVSQTNVSLFYINGIAAEQNVNTMRQRVTELEYDGILDSTILIQLIEDNSFSLFPQMLLTERPDRLANSLMEGKIAVIVDGSPYSIVGPTSFVSYFQTTEDFYVRWNMGMFMRLLRVFAMFFSVLFTAFYVAALTYHYEVIPSALIVPLGQSRSLVPFPPFVEAMFLEGIIELLREAGARLPTKVGQTMGIVGGIVIGQAAVQAGFTSNILIIIVALGALASFTAPSYMMGTAIRIIRFPMIVLAGLWGGIGITFGLCFILIHLLRLTSLGSPYLSPFYPLRVGDLKDSIVRFSFPFSSKRPVFTRAADTGRFNEGRAKEKKDIDE